ncbi:MAG TPA: PilZ domain-containing protein [Terriglobales bacterium]|nr:PilZ domain-containing protein [Terriglobales bacterium]
MGNRYEPRRLVRFPVIVSGTDLEGNSFTQTAYVCDISRRGAHLDGIGCLRGPGETIEIEYGGKKARFFVVWVGLPGMQEQAHIGVRLLERNKSIWNLDVPKPNADEFVRADVGISDAEQLMWDNDREMLLHDEPEEPDDPQSVSVAHLRQQKALQESQTSGDRRQYRRYAVDGGAELRTKGTQARTWGPLSDISASGCYVQMYVPCAAATELEMTLEVGGVQIVAEGVVKIVYPGLGIGIEFTQIADEYRQRLNELLAPRTA